MKYIAHRGNLSGPNKHNENSPSYLLDAMDAGFDVETDVWFIDGKFFLGHDTPNYEIDIQFLKNPKVWAHAKNIEALHEMLKYKSINCFWHQEDDYTLTSKGIMWSYPGKETYGNSVCVMPENVNFDCSFKSSWVCTDFVKWFEEKQKDGN
jgi:hypothetical protein